MSGGVSGEGDSSCLSPSAERSFRGPRFLCTPTPPASSYLLPVTVMRDGEGCDSAQFITTMEKPSHLSSWHWKGSTPYCFQGPFVFPLLTNQRSLKEHCWLKLDLQCDMTGRPGTVCSLRARLPVKCPRPIAVSRVRCYLKLPLPAGRSPPPTAGAEARFAQPPLQLWQSTPSGPPIRHTPFFSN